MALRISVFNTIVALLILLHLLIYYSIFVTMVMRHGKTTDNFDLHLNRTHLHLSVPKSLPEKTEYKTPLRKSNFLASARPPSVSATPPPMYQQANGTTFVQLRKSNLRVNNGGTDMPESLNHSPVHFVFLAHPQSVSATPPPYQQANGTTFVPLRKSNLKVNNGRTDMPDL